MTECKDVSSLQDLSAVSEEKVLELISQGSLRCRPCSNCRNSDPFQLELTQKDSVQHQSSSSRCLVCKKCQKPYNMAEDDDDDDDDGEGNMEGVNVNDDDAASSFPGTECRICRNKEKDLFAVTLSENGQQRTVECLVCEHRDDEKNSEFSGWIECPKCPNRTLDLFLVTQREDGRIHKVTCIVCGHGNTLHDPGLLRQPYQRNLVSWGGRVWSALGSVYSAIAPSVQKSIQSAADQGMQQVVMNVQNRRAVPHGLRQIGVRLVTSIGEEMVVHLGNKYLKNLVSSSMTKAFVANVGEVIRNLAAARLQETQKTKKKTNR